VQQGDQEIRKDGRKPDEPETPEFSGEKARRKIPTSFLEERERVEASVLLGRRHDVGIFAQRKFWRHRSALPDLLISLLIRKPFEGTPPFAQAGQA